MDLKIKMCKAGLLCYVLIIVIAVHSKADNTYYENQPWNTEEEDDESFNYNTSDGYYVGNYDEVYFCWKTEDFEVENAEFGNENYENNDQEFGWEDNEDNNPEFGREENEVDNREFGNEDYDQEFVKEDYEVDNQVFGSKDYENNYQEFGREDYEVDNQELEIQDYEINNPQGGKKDYENNDEEFGSEDYKDNNPEFGREDNEVDNRKFGGEDYGDNLEFETDDYEDDNLEIQREDHENNNLEIQREDYENDNLEIQREDNEDDNLEFGRELYEEEDQESENEDYEVDNREYESQDETLQDEYDGEIFLSKDINDYSNQKYSDSIHNADSSEATSTDNESAEENEDKNSISNKLQENKSISAKEEDKGIKSALDTVTSGDEEDENEVGYTDTSNVQINDDETDHNVDQENSDGESEEEGENDHEETFAKKSVRSRNDESNNNKKANNMDANDDNWKGNGIDESTDSFETINQENYAKKESTAGGTTFRTTEPLENSKEKPLNEKGDADNNEEEENPSNKIRNEFMKTRKHEQFGEIAQTLPKKQTVDTTRTTRDQNDHKHKNTVKPSGKTNEVVGEDSIGTDASVRKGETSDKRNAAKKATPSIQDSDKDKEFPDKTIKPKTLKHHTTPDTPAGKRSLHKENEDNDSKEFNESLDNAKPTKTQTYAKPKDTELQTVDTAESDQTPTHVFANDYQETTTDNENIGNSEKPLKKTHPAYHQKTVTPTHTQYESESSSSNVKETRKENTDSGKELHSESDDEKDNMAANFDSILYYIYTHSNNSFFKSLRENPELFQF